MLVKRQQQTIKHEVKMIKNIKFSAINTFLIILVVTSSVEDLKQFHFL